MRALFKRIPRFLREEKAQTTTEYIIIVALVALLAMKVGNELKDRLSQLLSGTLNKTEQGVDQMWGNEGF